MDINIHRVKEITDSGIDKHTISDSNQVYYTKEIKIQSEGETMVICCFSDTKAGLSIPK